MITARTIAEVRKYITAWRMAGRRIALVPTMGDLHRGHRALVEEAAGLAEKTAVSIFVNPLQFDDAQDLENYPRSVETDLGKLQAWNVDLVFVPACEEMYPPDCRHGLYVDAGDIAAILCGISRPGHFSGVATIVVKLFNIFQPDVAVFGKKDYQQLVLIRRLVHCLNLDMQIAAVETVREPDGLALSSRNGYLDREQNRQAAALYRVLNAAAAALRGGRGNAADEIQTLLDAACTELVMAGLVPDYVELRGLHTLEKVSLGKKLPEPRILLGAARIGKARLIDNINVDENVNDSRPRLKTVS